MTGGLENALTRISTRDASMAIRQGRIVSLFQPIEALQTGACRGFEALARLSRNGRLIGPNAFLKGLDADDRFCLFGSMLGQGIALLKSLDARDLYVSINVEISLLVDANFVDVLEHHLEKHDFAGQQLVLEVLESEEISDFSRLAGNLEAVRRLGISVALDDIGSAYASLTKIRDLPIDIFKLDRSFSRDLEMHPEDLIFTLSILSLARGLEKRMVVEGIETSEVYDALRIMGVELGQGYAIAAPMPAAEVATWLAGRELREPNQGPRCLLGAYASQLTVIETCRSLRRQPLPVAWTQDAFDHVNCVVGKLFTARGWHDTAFGDAHRRFHAALSVYATDVAKWTQAAEHFRDTMACAICERPKEMRCDPVDSAAAPTTVAPEVRPATRLRRVV